MTKLNWRPIAEARKDGRDYLLLIPIENVSIGGLHLQDFVIRGWYCGVPESDGWDTCVGTLGSPTMFAEVNFPDY